MVFQGPVRPGTSVKTFRETGRSVPRGGGRFAGPVRPGRDEKIFRATGESVTIGSARAIELEKQIKRIEAQRIEAQRIVDEKKRIEELRKKLEREHAQRRERILIDKISRDKIKQKTLINRRTGERILTLTNLRTGEVKTRTYERPKIGRGTRLSGGITERKEKLPTGEIREVPKKFDTKREKLLSQAKQEQSILQTKLLRGKKLTLKEQGRLAVLQTKIIGLEILLIPKGLKEFAIAVKKNPSILKEVPSSIKQELVTNAKMLRIDPTSGVVKIGGEVLFWVGGGKVLQVIGKLGSKSATRLSPAFRKIKDSKVRVPSGQAGKKFIDIEIVKPGLAKITTPLKKQVKIAGKKIPVVTSAQAEQIVSFLKAKRIVRKPIPNENLLRASTKRLLKLFDEGRLNRNQMIVLDKRIKIETKGAGSILERSFFVDPEARIRISRLGIREQPDASLLDVLSGDVSFRTSKPQILIFENIKVQGFPKTKIFNIIKNKLQKGKTLSKLEAEALVKFQTKISGKFKPVGFLSKEPELTLAPGEIIRKIKQVGVTLINGKRISIVRADVVKATQLTKNLIRKSKTGKISAKELNELRKRLKKETRFDSPTLSRPTGVKPRVSLKRALARIIPRVRIKRKPRPTPRKAKPSPRRITRVKRPGRITPRIKKPIRRPTKPTPRPSPRVVRGRIRPPIVTPKPRPILTIPKGFSKRTLSKSVPVYFVKVKRRGKIVNLSERPLTLRDAKDYLAYKVDHGLIRSAWFEPLGTTKKVVSLPKSMKGYFGRISKKLRPFKIRAGKKKAIRQGYIEKRKYIQDTRGEKLSLLRARSKKKIRKKKRQ